MEKEMATHSSTLAWKIPQMAEPGGLPSMGSHRVGHDWRDLATAAAEKPQCACAHKQWVDVNHSQLILAILLLHLILWIFDFWEIYN